MGVDLPDVLALPWVKIQAPDIIAIPAEFIFDADVLLRVATVARS